MFGISSRNLDTRIMTISTMCILDHINDIYYLHFITVSVVFLAVLRLQNMVVHATGLMGIAWIWAAGPKQLD